MEEERRQRDILPTKTNAQPTNAEGNPLDFDPQLKEAVKVLQQELQADPAVVKAG
jgi:hypothetical protein